MIGNGLLDTKITEMEGLLRKGDVNVIQSFYKNDPQRPLFHFAGTGWMNDINGLIYWKGRYHIFYQAYPFGAYWCNISWGHASSSDFVNWEIHPIILEPVPDGHDRKGVFSGHTFFDDNGTPTIIYYGVPDGICLAVPEDIDDPLLLKWKRHLNNPVIAQPGPDHEEHDKYMIYDPSKPWKESGYWYTLAGNLYNGDKAFVEGDVTYLFKSPDLLKWEFVGPLYKSLRKWTVPQEDCAVPCFFTLKDKHVLVFSSHVFGTQYYTGVYENNVFVPECHDRISFPGGITSGSIVSNVQDGRTIHIGWINEDRDEKSQRASGWSGLMSIPWELTLREDGLLSARPASEILKLRKNERSLQNISLKSVKEQRLAGFDGDVLELELTIDPGTSPLCGVKVRSSGDGQEETGIYYDAINELIRIDLRRSSLDPRVEYKKYFYIPENIPVTQRMVSFTEAPFKLMEGEKLHLNIFLDKSVIEIFANGRRTMVQRVYPTLERSKGIALFSKDGEATVECITVWDMTP
ncbi:MAG: glycoside hydrolase family 32 protein [Candidatus Humimicrobiaceae bacterium]